MDWLLIPFNICNYVRKEMSDNWSAYLVLYGKEKEKNDSQWPIAFGYINNSDELTWKEKIDILEIPQVIKYK